MPPFEINYETYEKAAAARRDLLFLFTEMVESYQGFAADLETGSFDPYVFVDCRLGEEPGWTFQVDTRLLREGSVVKLLAWQVDCWEQSGDIRSDRELMNGIKTLLASNTLHDLPLAAETLRLGLQSAEELQDGLPDVYEQYVLGYFQRLLGLR